MRKTETSRREFLELGGKVLAGASLLGVAGCGARSESNGSKQEFTLRLAHELTPQTVKGKTAVRFAKILQKKTDGQIKVNIFPNGELVGGDELPQSVGDGTADMSIVASADLSVIAPELQVLDLPFVIENLDQLSEVTARDTAVGKILFDNKKLSNNGLRVVAPYASGIKQISTNTETRNLSDMKGQRIRVQQSKALRDTYRAWNAKPVQIADFGEVYTGLEQGVIEGQENPYATILGESVYEVQDYIVELNHGYVGYLGIINQEFLESLPDDLRKSVIEAANESSEYNLSIAQDENDKAKKEILDKGGTEIIQITDQDRQDFKEAVVPRIWNESAEVVGQDAIDEIIARNK